MRMLLLVLCLLVSTVSNAADDKAVDVSKERMNELVVAVNDASNKMLMRGSTLDDVDHLFSMYTEDFQYVHDTYGGVYTRDKLYNNSVRNVKAGRYNLTEGRYRVMNVMLGLNAAAVERLETKSGKIHLTIFEFKQDKVSKIIEYWK